MAWNPSPKVAAARDIADKFNFDQVIVIGIDNRNGKMESISYGETKMKCSDAKNLADVAYSGIYSELEKRI